MTDPNFDDTIYQIKVFRNALEKFKIIILNYSPNLRYFFNRQNIVGIDYISVFDEIQNINNYSQRMFSYDDLNWEEGLEYIYTPFLVMIRKKNQKYANVQLTDEGNIMYIDFFEKNIIVKKFVFDDRGFLSSILYFNDKGEGIYQDYLNLSGVWQIREHFLNNNIIEINPNADKYFKKKIYKNMEELIAEKIEYIIDNNANIILAANELHNDLIFNIEKEKQIIMSFYEDRFDIKDNKLLYYSEKSKLLVVDNVNNVLLMRNLLGKESDNKIKHIPAYDTRLELGKSQQKKELIIYLTTENHNKEELKTVIILLMEEIVKNKNVSLILGSYAKVYSREFLEKFLKDIIKENFEGILELPTEETLQENNIYEAMKSDNIIQADIRINIITNEINIIKSLKYARLIINLGKRPDLLTTITGISAGIPQINSVENNYVENYKNGIIIDDINKLSNAINYYFVGLENWNKSLVYSFKQIKNYTSGEIVKEWKKYLED